MARWFSVFAEYNFVVYYKPGKTNILADALSRRSDYDPKTKNKETNEACRSCEDVQAIAVQATTTVLEEIIEGYKSDEACQDLLKYFEDPSDMDCRAYLLKQDREFIASEYTTGCCTRRWKLRIQRELLFPTMKLRHGLLYEYHDSPSGGRIGRENVSQSFPRLLLATHVQVGLQVCEIL